jgi:hypothetical protein
MRLMRLLAGTGLVLALGFGTPMLAQEEPVPPPAEPEAPSAEPATPSPEPAAPEDAAEDAEKEKHFGLYVEAGAGQVSAEDIQSSIETLSTSTTSSYFSLEDQQYVRVALGWQLPHGKGDFRLRFEGFSEDGFKLSSKGYQQSLGPDSPAGPIPGNLLWWTFDSVNGEVHAVRNPPMYDPATEEIYYDDPDRDYQSFTTSDMQNRAQVIDVLYGRTFGKRRYTARWWGGLRSFKYDGNIQAGAWLFTVPTGNGFTDNELLPLLTFRQEARGYGPTGAMEADFNFFDQRFTIFLSGQVAFLLSEISVDSGLFSTLVESSPYWIPAPARLEESRDMSSWQLSAEAGLRYRFRCGLQLEAAYFQTGFLNVILLPIEMQIPTNQLEIRQGTSALYETHDYILTGWRAGVAFQF